MCEHSQHYADFIQRASIDFQRIQLITFLTGAIDDQPGSWKAKIIRAHYLVDPEQQTKPIGIKCVLRNFNQDAQSQNSALKRELAVWCRLNNSNIISLIGTVAISSVMGLGSCLQPSAVFDYCEHGDALQYINSKPEPSVLDRLKLLQGVASGLEYLHKINVVHGDIKGANILVDLNKRAKLCDFGSAYMSPCTETGCIVGPPGDFHLLTTHRYLSPEVLFADEAPTTRQSDIWALGCVLLELQTGVIAYRAETDMLSRQKQALGRLPARASAFSKNQISLAVGQIALKCWAKAPEDRPSAAGVVQDLNSVNVAHFTN